MVLEIMNIEFDEKDKKEIINNKDIYPNLYELVVKHNQHNFKVIEVKNGGSNSNG